MGAIRDLSRKAGLRFTIIADMRKLGLIEHLLLIKTRRVGELCRVLARFPFCRQVFRTYGSSDLFCVFDIPTEHAVFTREFAEQMHERQLLSEFKVVDLLKDLQAVNFARYDPSEGRWNVHWDTWGMSLRESLSNDAQSTFWPTNDDQRCSLDKLDLRILFSLQSDCRVSYAAMGRSLGVSGAYIGRKIERMVREQVFRYAVWPLKIAAEDWGVIGLSCSKNVASVLAKYISELPAWRGGLVSGDFEGLVAIVWSPSGEMKQFFKSVDDRLIRTGKAEAHSLDTVGEWVVARWLPVEPYPWDLANETGDWIFDEGRYRSLLN
jgi:DNA-binding Lrp family transcriptional regulator